MSETIIITKWLSLILEQTKLAKLLQHRLIRFRERNTFCLMNRNESPQMPPNTACTRSRTPNGAGEHRDRLVEVYAFSPVPTLSCLSWPPGHGTDSPGDGAVR